MHIVIKYCCKGLRIAFSRFGCCLHSSCVVVVVLLLLLLSKRVSCNRRGCNRARLTVLLCLLIQANSNNRDNKVDCSVVVLSREEEQVKPRKTQGQGRQEQLWWFECGVLCLEGITGIGCLVWCYSWSGKVQLGDNTPG